MKCPHCDNRVWFWQDKIYHFSDDSIGLYFGSKPHSVFKSLSDGKLEKYHLDCYKFMIWQESLMRREQATITDEGSIFNHYRRLLETSLQGFDNWSSIRLGSYPTDEDRASSKNEIIIMEGEDEPDNVVVAIEDENDDRWKKYIERRLKGWK